MKALIWIGCIFSLSLCLVFIRYAGVILGGIPSAALFAGMWFLARFLCKKWDEHKKSKKENNSEDETNG